MKTNLLYQTVPTLLIFVVLLCFCTPGEAGTKVHVGKSWPAAERVSFDQVDHRPLDGLLQKYVNEAGYVNYQAWRASRQDRAALQQYLASLSRVNPQKQATREAQLAFWINAYNAVTLEGILQKYPLSSIRDYTPKLWGYHIWKDLLLTVGDQQVSLEHMEHQILRKMKEPRVHFAIVCASIGCPRLMNRAYFSQSLDEQLTTNAKNFFSDPGRFRYDAARRELSVSPILSWFAEDFGRDQAEQMRTIAPFLPDEGAKSLAMSGQASVRYLGYDWGLNDQVKQR